MSVITERHATALLLHTRRPSPCALDALLEHCGGPLPALRHLLAGNVPTGLEHELDLPLDTIGEYVHQLESGAVRLLTTDDDAWPVQIPRSFPGDLHPTSPDAFWIHGHEHLASLASGVAIVGTDFSSSHNLHLAAEVTRQLFQRGHTIIIAGVGQPGAQHPSIAVAAINALLSYPLRGRVVVVLHRDPTRMVDPQQQALVADLLSAGALVVTDCRLTGHTHIPRLSARNRLVAALATSTVLIESNLSCQGDDIARHALELERPLYGIPGPSTTASSAGVNHLLNTGLATPLTDPDQVEHAQHSTASTAAR